MHPADSECAYKVSPHPYHNDHRLDEVSVLGVVVSAGLFGHGDEGGGPPDGPRLLGDNLRHCLGLGRAAWQCGGAVFALLPLL